jgi:hypothetical protein
MTTSDAPHWFTRCGKSVQDWLLSDPDRPLTTVALDAVIGAGGIPVRRSATENERSEAYYLRPADSAYLAELRAAGFSGDGR